MSVAARSARGCVGALAIVCLRTMEFPHSDSAEFPHSDSSVLAYADIPQDREALCSDAHRFLVEELAMAAVTEPDDVDDWRTGRVTAGCRVTAAGLTNVTLRAQARAAFERLRAGGWTRTPDPRDAPGEASLRFRRGEADCLYSFYSGGLLGTEAEAEVDDARVPAEGQLRFNFLILCVPAGPAAPRL